MRALFLACSIVAVSAQTVTGTSIGVPLCVSEKECRSILRKLDHKGQYAGDALTPLRRAIQTGNPTTECAGYRNHGHSESHANGAVFAVRVELKQTSKLQPRPNNVERTRRCKSFSGLRI
jgi:hypothetical protein